MIAQLAVAIAAIYLGAPPPVDPADSTIVVDLEVSKPAAIEKVMAAMTSEGLQIAQSEATGLVVGVGDGPKNTTVAYSATILTNGAGSRVVLSAEATSKASIHMAGASYTPRTRVTSKTKGGGKVWAEVQRLAELIQKAP